MPKQLTKIEMERDSLQQKWGITIQGGQDLSLTAKIASVKVKIVARATRRDFFKVSENMKMVQFKGRWLMSLNFVNCISPRKQAENGLQS